MEANQVRQKEPPEIIEMIEQGALNPKFLSGSLLDACIEYLCFERGVPKYSAARLLQRNRNTINAHAAKILKKRSEELKARGIDIYELAQRLTWNTELTMYHALKEKDFRLYNDTYHKYIERLQSLGVIYKAPAQLELHTFSEEKWNELENIVIEVLEFYPGAKEDLILRLKQQRSSLNGSGNGHDG